MLMTLESMPNQAAPPATSGIPQGMSHGRVRDSLARWTVGERQFAGPGRFRFEIDHTHCCRERGHPPGWCDSQPEREDRPRKQKRLRPEPAELELALNSVVIDEAIAALTPMQQIAVRAWAAICFRLGYPPLDNDKGARWAWEDAAKPLWQQIARQHNIQTDYERNLSRTRQLKQALWDACTKMARSTGWRPAEERAAGG